MKTRKTFGIIGIILSVLALAGIVVAGEFANISMLWGLIPVGTLAVSLLTAFVKPDNKKTLDKIIAWLLAGLAFVGTVIVAITAGWFCLLPLIALLGVLCWLTWLHNWEPIWYWIFGISIILVVIIGIILWGVATIVNNDAQKIDTLYVENLIADKIEATEVEATEANVDTLIVDDNVMVGGDLAVNNDVVVNNGDINIEQGDVNVEQGDVNVEGDVNVGGDVNVTEPPATEPSVTTPPTTTPPATEPPATEPPATEPPATEPPATEPPVTPKFTLVDSGDGWWIVKFEGMNSADITLDNASKGSVTWMSVNTLKVTKTCEGTMYFSLTDNASGEVIYLF